MKLRPWGPKSHCDRMRMWSAPSSRRARSDASLLLPYAERGRGWIVLVVGPADPAVEDVIRSVGHHENAALPARPGDVPGSFPVERRRRALLFLGAVDRGVGGAVDDGGRAELRHDPFDDGGTGDVALLRVRRKEIPGAVEGGADFPAEEPPAPRHEDPPPRARRGGRHPMRPVHARYLPTDPIPLSVNPSL